MAHVTRQNLASSAFGLLTWRGKRHGDMQVVKPRQRLGWRLTASYAFVTVAVLIVIELVFLAVGSIWVGVALHRNGSTISADLQGEASARMAPLFPHGIPDPAGIDRELRFVQVNGIVPNQEHPVQLRPDASVIAMPETKLLILDTGGRIIGSIKQQSVPANSIQVTNADVPAITDALAAVSAGQRYTVPLLRWPLPRHMMVAVPITDSQGEVIGSIVFSARSPVNAWIEALGRTLALTALGVIVLGALIGTISGAIAARQLTVRLDRMSDAAAAWGSGDFSIAVADGSEDELGQLARRLNRMAEQLALLIRARERLSVVDERNRLARDLHDSVKQQAFAVSMNLGSARELWERDPIQSRRQIDTAYEIARQTQHELTAIIQTLRPVELSHSSVDRALSDYLIQWQAHTGIVARTEISDVTPIPDLTEDALFRVAQEALANVARHSKATKIWVRLSRSGGTVAVEIADDGAGFDPRRTRPGIGLQSMRERVESLGGSLLVKSGADGTRIMVRVPATNASGI